MLSVLVAIGGERRLLAAGPQQAGSWGFAPARALGAPVRPIPGQAPPAATQQIKPGQPTAEGRRIWCGQEIGPPSQLPPVGSGPVLYLFGGCFPDQGGASVIEPQTYLFYIQLRASQPSKGEWTPWNEETEKVVRDDFKRLWGTTFLDNLSIEVTDYLFTNGVIGKLVAYNMEERQRVKIVDYEGTKQLDMSKIDEKLKEESAQISLDSFIDPGRVRKVKQILLDMLAEKGYQFATVDAQIKPRPDGPKLVNLTFRVDEGPQVKIRAVRFVGNKAKGAFWLGRQMKNNKPPRFYSFITGRSTYQEAKYEEDASAIEAYYRNHGYLGARVREPELKYLEEPSGTSGKGGKGKKKVRWVELRIPIEEGERYKVADFTFDGNKVVKSEALRGLFKLKTGDWYNEKAIRKGIEKVRDAYGAHGYFEFSAYPDNQLHPTGAPAATGAAAGKAGTAATPGPGAPGQPAAKPVAGPRAPARGTASSVDVVMRIQENKQYFVNRILFTGNTTTRDTVVRREMRLFEEGLFDTEALKYSIKRINQLGYFKPLEGGKDIDIQKTPGGEGRVDVTLKMEEQNRNQVTFSAGVSQIDGFFGMLGYQTANFMGRGETFGVNAQFGTRAQNYQVSFSEPYLFDRPITGGITAFYRRLEYIGQFTQQTKGVVVPFGFTLRSFTRLYLSYSYEHTKMLDVNPSFTDPSVIAAYPYLADQLLLGAGGVRKISKIVPSVMYDTVDHPIFPTSGNRYVASVDVAGIGGDTDFYKPRVEAIWYIKHTSRTSVGVHVLAEYVNRFGGDVTGLPLSERLNLGGEYSVRGYDLRTIGPRAFAPIYPSYGGVNFLPAFMAGQVPLNVVMRDTGLVTGGNKSVLFNAEYLISIASPVRLVLFFDAGQVRDQGEKLRMNEFKTSTGGEIRFFMPVLNVPFRLIFAFNPHRAGILDNTGQPQSGFAFKFAIGSTF